MERLVYSRSVAAKGADDTDNVLHRPTHSDNGYPFPCLAPSNYDKINLGIGSSEARDNGDGRVHLAFQVLPALTTR